MYVQGLDWMMHFGEWETLHSTTRHHTQGYLWAPNCSHSTLILVCCSTSPSWRVQRLSHGDWPSPQLIFAGLECKEGPQCTSVCCVSILRILFPLTSAMFHVVKGGHVLLFWSVAETRLGFAAIANTAGCTKRHSNVTSFSWSGKFGGRSQDLTQNCPCSSPWLFIQDTNIDQQTSSHWPGKACMTFRWKIYFTSKCQGKK